MAPVSPGTPSGAESKAALARKKYAPTIDPPYRWRDWAANDTLTGGDLLNYLTAEEAICPNATRGPGLISYLRSFGGSAEPKRQVVGRVFDGVINGMESGYLLRAIVRASN